MRIFAFCIAMAYFALFAAGERASLNIYTTPEGADVFLDSNPEKELLGTPFENSAMLTGEHSVFLLPQNESFVPAAYDFILQRGEVHTINHDFLRRNQAYGAYTLSPSADHIEINSGFSYEDSNRKIPFDFRFGLPFGFGARFAFPVESGEIDNFSLGLQYNYTPLQIGFAADWISPRGEGFSAIRAVMLAEQNIFFLNLLENIVYEYSKKDDWNFYLRVGIPVKHIFMPYLAVKKNMLDPGALLQVGNRFSLEISVPVDKNFDAGFHFGIHADFSLGKTIKKNNYSSAIIWDVHQVSNREYKNFCEETGKRCDIPSDDYPVISISLSDAIQYSKWAKKRLPTAEEWKRAASTFSNFNECENPSLKKTKEGDLINGMRNFSANTAIWLLPEDETLHFATFAGSSYGDSPEACRKKSVLTDISSPSGNKYIGIRLVREIPNN